MGKKKRLILLFFLFILYNLGTLSGKDSIAVTYIANCGYLIEIDSVKIIIDGLFKLGHNHYPTPDISAQKLLVSNKYPFNDIDLILVSHVHEDHFDSEMVRECMLNNPTANLLCPQQVTDSIRKNESVYNTIKSRIIDCTPDAFTSMEVNVGDIEIHACRLAHPGEKHKSIQNIAYLVSVYGKSVFHSSDIDPLQIDKYSGIKLNEMSIDIGMLNEDFAKVENAGLAKSFINAHNNIAMHLPEIAASGWLESFKDKPDMFSNPFIFKKKMERRIFYTDIVN